MTMGRGKFVKQQRAIKFAKEAKKSLMAMGMGSGKSASQIGTFTDLHGEGKVKRGLFVVPSVVKRQFGEEVSRFTEPGRYKYHAEDASKEERYKAYKDPGTHMVVATHQTFRDDALDLMAEHRGLEPEQMKQAFEKASPKDRRQILRDSFEHHGMGNLLDYIAMDEAHDALGREGKKDSFLQMITDAALGESGHAIVATGTPIKNDASEAFSWLSKLHPEKWEGRENTFKRQYGNNLATSQEAFKREMGRYTYATQIPSGVNRKDVWGRENESGNHSPIQLSDIQQSKLSAVTEAYGKAREAAREGKADIDSLKVLSPNSFDGTNDEGVAQRLNQSLSTLHYAARSRVVDAAPLEHNAKIQHLLKLADGYKKEGKPGVIFAHSLNAVHQISEALKAQGHKVSTITGSDTSDSKAQKRQEFHPDKGEAKSDILVLSDSGQAGLNLQRGQWLANYDLPPTYKTLAQRNARIDRLGQRNPVTIHHLQTDTKHDRDSISRLSKKKELQDAFVGGFDSMDDSGLAGYIQRAKNPYAEAAD
jgi:SNF2 family DNA or RNA helicase